MEKEAIFKKLRFKFADNKLIVNAPEEYFEILNGVEFDSVPDESKIGKYDFVQVFASSQAEMELLVQQVAIAGKFNCLFWICYPKSKGKIKYDLNRDTLGPAFDLAGLRPVTQIAIDEKWSALRGRKPEMIGK
jgi:hypothetical protein